MKVQLPVYLEPDNKEWLKNKAIESGLSQSGIVNLLVSQRRKQENNINEANRKLEDARLADLELV